MRLRSRSIADPSSARFNGRWNSKRKERNVTQTDEEVQQPDDQSLYSDDIPTATKRPLVQGRGRKRVAALDYEDREDVRTPSSGDVMSPEQCVFGYGSISLLAGDEDRNDTFSPFSFIKNIPSKCQQSKPCIRDIPPKTRSTPQATLVLDLDETLMYSSLNVIEDAEYTFRTCFQDNPYKVYVILRPYVKEFLEAMTKHFEMFVYTSAKKEYAEKILDILDPKRRLFRHRLYQQDCTCVLGHYVKDLGVLERDLAKTVVLDNAPHTYPYHLMNVLPIKSWSGNDDDKELQKLIPCLERLSGADNPSTGQVWHIKKLIKQHDHYTGAPCAGDNNRPQMSQVLKERAIGMLTA
ncbi:CTD small phosphatase-like protein 2-A isoform X3 [Salvelinus alpinus]|uniref:CTD small phosphatase-like protein 2-A isoform X3 n=1 Tax=Salvelinus alpinus TaxID=8036 RepID=UPI0039FC9F9B